MTNVAKMRIAFRVDASIEIGTGHVMRCLTLAEALKGLGAKCHFICREHEGHLLEVIGNRGFSANALPLGEPGENGLAHGRWLGCGWRTDAEQTGEFLTAIKPDWLVVDHYAIDHRWEVELQAHYRKLMVIDDLADRPHFCHLLLNQNLGFEAENYIDLVPQDCNLLIGPQYALLRPEFAALREYSLKRRQGAHSLKQLLITMGGVDRLNATGTVLKALEGCDLPSDCCIVVVMGQKSPWVTQVRKVAETMPWPTEVRVGISDMAKVIADSDLCIGAAGSTSWECCCLGLPSIIVVIARNQLIIAKALQASGAAMVFQIENILHDQLNTGVSSMRENQTLLKMSKSASKITDGAGICSIIKKLNKSV
jgi:UDP-2,4-diacetamido-2,4,6-trideoxy-beta-L-altropyranose hydrolase